MSLIAFPFVLGFSNETFYTDLPYEEIKEIVEQVNLRIEAMSFLQ